MYIFSSISIIYGGLAHLMYIWKEAIHGNRHADQDADYRARHTKRTFEGSGLLR